MYLGGRSHTEKLQLQLKNTEERSKHVGVFILITAICYVHVQVFYVITHSGM